MNFTVDTMEYADSVQQVLLRKISKAEKDLLQLKLDYCRFIFGLTHRSRVSIGAHTYQVSSVDVESMVRLEDGTFTKPLLTGILTDSAPGAEATILGADWSLVNGVIECRK